MWWVVSGDVVSIPIKYNGNEQNLNTSDTCKVLWLIFGSVQLLHKPFFRTIIDLYRIGLYSPRPHHIIYLLF